MDRRDFIKTFGLGVATATVAPKILFSEKDILIAGRNYDVTYSPNRADDLRNYGAIKDIRLEIRKLFNKQLKKYNSGYNDFMPFPASLMMYEETGNKVGTRPVVAKTHKPDFNPLPLNRVIEGEPYNTFRYESDARKLYNYISRYLNQRGDNTYLGYYDICSQKMKLDGDFGGKEYWTFWIRDGRVKLKDNEKLITKEMREKNNLEFKDYV